MITKKNFPIVLGAPAVLGLMASPLFATIERHEDVGRSFVDITEIEIRYPQFAQVGGDDIGGQDNSSSNDNDERSNRRVVTGPAVTVSDGQTEQIVSRLREFQRLCEFMGDEYRISCFAQTYRELANDIPANGDYEEARKAILDAAKKLDNLTRRNLDRSKPALTASVTNNAGQKVSTPPIRPVRIDRAPQLNQQAAQIVEEAETVLLRTASSDATRAIHYQRIAAAVNSNKVLLRSS